MSTIAFVGLGIMGAPMARHLVDAGHEVLGVNRCKPAVDQLVKTGGTISDAISAADVVTTLPLERRTTGGTP